MQRAGVGPTRGGRMKRTTIVLIAVIIICLSVAGCGGGGAVTPPDTGGDASGGGSGLTAAEAARLAVSEARAWSADAVLWELGPAPETLDTKWTSNGRAGEWFVSYARSSDQRCFTVDVENGAVARAEEDATVSRRVAIPSSAPRDAPRVSLAQAASAARDAGMPERPSEPAVFYTFDSPTQAWDGKPVWQLGCDSPEGGRWYIVDGMSGKLIAVLDVLGKPVGSETEPAKPAGDAREVIKEFFALLDAGEGEQALQLMAARARGNDQTRSMWLVSFEGIDSIALTKTEERLKENWSNSIQYYRCSLTIRLKPGEQPGLWEDGTVTRYVSVTAEDGAWKIAEISMNP